MISAQRIGLLLFVLNLTACAGIPGKVDLATEARVEINAVAVSVAVPQKAINAQIQQSAVAVVTLGGAIPALIDAAIDSRRSRKQEELIAPIRDALDGYDYPSVLAQEVERRLGKIEWFQLSKVEIDREAAEDRFDRITKGAGADAVLFVTVDYSLFPDLAGLVVQAEFAMLPGTESLHAYSDKPIAKRQALDKTHVIFRDRVHTQFPLDVTNNPEENVRLLSESGALAIRRALDEGAVRIARRLVGALQAMEE